MATLDKATSTWGIAQPVRKVLRQSILALRGALEDDTRRQLASLGITAVGVGTAPGGRVLTAEEAHAREVVTALVERARTAGDPHREAFDDAIREIAFTFLDRAVALRCLEERGLLIVVGQPETVIKRDPVRGSASLVWQVRSEGGRGPQEVVREAFRRACAAVSQRVRELFDPDAEHAVLFPLLPTWEQVVTALNDPAVPSETYAEDEVLGWVYQYWNSAAKDAVYAKLGKGGKIETPEELSAASCLYTERYIVDYLVQNTLGALWLEMHPDSGLAAAWPYYVRPPEGNPPVERPVKRVRDITLLDPACGSGHFLVRAFEVFAQLYAEEGIEDPAEIPALILEHNLHGIDIDRRAVQIAALVLYLKGCSVAGPGFRPRRLNLVAADIVLPPQPPPDLLATFEEPELVDVARSLWAGLQGIRDFGSLLHPERTVDEAFAKLRKDEKGSIWARDDAHWQERRTQLLGALHWSFEQAAGDTDLGRRLFGQEAERGLDLLELLAAHYDVVVVNPPYVGSRNLRAPEKRYLEREYVDGKRDMATAFVLRCEQFGHAHARLGSVTQQAWLFLRGFASMRESYLRRTRCHSIAHLGTGAFEEIGGEVVNVAAVVVVREPSRRNHRIVCQRLVGLPTAGHKSRSMRDVATDRVEGLIYLPLQSELLDIPESPLAYWLGPRFVALLKSTARLRDVAAVRIGLCTGDNDRFIRRYWENTRVSPPWVWCAKAGGHCRWYGLQQHVVHWIGDGSEYLKVPGSAVRNVDSFFQGGLTYGRIAQGALGTRILERDEAFEQTSIGVFPEARAHLGVMSFLNSRLASFLARVVTQGIEFNAGYVANLPLARGLPNGMAEAGMVLKAALVGLNLLERRFAVLRQEAPDPRLPDAQQLACHLHALEGWNERLVFDAYELDKADVQAVLDETGFPPGWHPLIAGYDRLPEPPEGIMIPDGLSAFLDTLEHRQLSASELAAVKARLRRLYEAGPGAKEDEEASGGGDDEDGAALGARIPISVHWLLEELRAEGVVCPPEEKREREDYVSVTLLRMLGYRWPEQDAHEAEHGPILDPDLVDADGIIPLLPCADEPVAAERVRTRLERQLGEEGAERFLADFKRYTKRELPDWLEREFFKRHARQFKNRPIAWHLRSTAGHFSVLVLYHRLSRETLEQLRTTYAGGRIARLRADQERARQRGLVNIVSDLQVAIEDVETFRARLEAIERGDTLADRIRCRWMGTDTNGRPGPYAPDIDDGVKVNIRPFQEQGLLAAKVITKW